jgi:hypothetical protein
MLVAHIATAALDVCCKCAWALRAAGIERAEEKAVFSTGT